MTEPQTPRRRRFPKPKPPGTALAATIPGQLTTTEEKARLVELEQIIQRGQRTFVEVGAALVEIRERKLYRHLGYQSFDSYLYERWDGMSKTHANRQIEAANTQLRLTPIGVTLPNEHVARLVKPYVGDLTLRVQKNGQSPVAALHAVVEAARSKPKPKPKPVQRALQLGPPVLITHNDGDDSLAIEDILASEFKLLLERIRDLPTSRARTLLQPFEAELLELLDLLGYEREPV